MKLEFEFLFSGRTVTILLWKFWQCMMWFDWNKLIMWKMKRIFYLKFTILLLLICYGFTRTRVYSICSSHTSVGVNYFHICGALVVSIVTHLCFIRWKSYRLWNTYILWRLCTEIWNLKISCSTGMAMSRSQILVLVDRQVVHVLTEDLLLRVNVFLWVAEDKGRPPDVFEPLVS